MLLVQCAGAALAADWQLVLSDRNRRVEIDRSSILNSDGGTKISWGRVVLTTDEARASGYAMIKALNRYDCRKRSFATVKRVYVDALDNIVREEPVADQSFLEVARNSVDERMWREVCAPPSVADLRKLANEASRLAGAAARDGADAAMPAQQPAAAAVAARAPAAKPPAASPAAPEPAQAVPAPPVAPKTPATADAAAGRQHAGSISTAGETAPPPLRNVAAEATEAVPALETHVEIPAKFLPGGQAANTEDAPRKSILPPLPNIAAKAGAAKPDASESAEKPAQTQRTRAPARQTGPAPTASASAPEPAPEPAPKPSATPKTPAPRASAPIVVAAPKPRPAATRQAAEATPPTPRAARKPAAPRAPAAEASAAARKPTRGGARSAAGQPAAPVREVAPAELASAAPVAASSAPDAIVGQLEEQDGRSPRPSVAAQGWSYAGETGPEHWGRLRPEWRVCEEGQRQSPIDLRDGLAVNLAPVNFHYQRSGFRIRDTGNLLQVDVGNGMGMIVRGVRYALEGFTLHRPSQDRVGGMAHDMAAYLLHRSADGRQAIVSVLLSAGGEDHPLFGTLWSNLPLDRGREFTPEAVIDLATLLPQDPAHFLYTGSLPMPPCTEDVLWVVMKAPVKISSAQLDVFSRLYPRNGRPIQPVNGRLVLESR